MRSSKTSRKTPRFKSKFERTFYDHVTKLGIKVQYEADTLKYTLDCLYKPDWKVDDGVYWETKGKFDYVERRKILAVKEANPNTDVRLVFMRNQKLSKRSSTTYGDWCDKHGIKWSVFPNLPL